MLGRRLFRSTALSPQKTLFSRGFITSAPRQNNHHDDHHDDHHGAEEQPEEHLLDNPNYIAIFSGVFIGTGLVAIDSSYKESTGESLFGKYIKTTSDEEIIDENIQFSKSIDEEVKVYDAFFVQPEKNPFGKIGGAEVLRRGSPFNYEPGSAIDLDKVGPRRSNNRLLD